MRTCPAGSAPRTAGRGSSTHVEPGLRTAGVATLRVLASWGTSRKRAVWYWMATLPLPVRHGDPAGAAQADIGQSRASTRRKSSSLTREVIHTAFRFLGLYATTYETEDALDSRCSADCFTSDH